MALDWRPRPCRGLAALPTGRTSGPRMLVGCLDCWVFFGQCLFVFQAAFVKFRSSRSTSFGMRYPRAE